MRMNFTYCDYLLLEKIQVKHIWGVRQQMSERNLCGQRYGRLTALRQADKPQNCKTKSDYWLCRCDCGNEVVVLGSNLVRGHTKSCGSLKQNDLTGKHIGKLTVLGRSDKYASRGKRRVRLWECRCDCGNITYKATDTLTSSAENSCAECAQKRNADCARNNAGFVDGTQLCKIRDMKPTAANTSGCRGVTYDRKTGLWEAKIKFRGKSNRLGYFKRFGDAVAARKKAENTVFGEFLDSLEQNAGNRSV